MSAGNRLTAEQLAALAPSDTVTIESGQEFGRRRHVTGIVARVEGPCVYVRCEGPRGGVYVERYSLRDGFRLGGGTRAELVNAEPDDPAARNRLLRETRQIDALYRAWSRRRGDAEALRELHAAIGERLEALLGQTSHQRP